MWDGNWCGTGSVGRIVECAVAQKQDDCATAIETGDVDANVVAGHVVDQRHG